MKKLKLNIEELTDLWWALMEITEGIVREEFPALFSRLDIIAEARESYRVTFPRDPDLEGFIATCREIQKEEKSEDRKEKLRLLKEINKAHVETLKAFYKEQRQKQSLDTQLEFEPLSESDLPADITEQQIATLRQLLSN